MNRTTLNGTSYFKKQRPVRYEHSVKGLLARTKICQLCSKVVPYGKYKAHFQSCPLSPNDSDVEVLTELTAKEKALRASAKATLVNIADGDEDLVKEETVDLQKEVKNLRIQSQVRAEPRETSCVTPNQPENVDDFRNECGPQGDNSALGIVDENQVLEISHLDTTSLTLERNNDEENCPAKRPRKPAQNTNTRKSSQPRAALTMKCDLEVEASSSTHVFEPNLPVTPTREKLEIDANALTINAPDAGEQSIGVGFTTSFNQGKMSVRRNFPMASRKSSQLDVNELTPDVAEFCTKDFPQLRFSSNVQHSDVKVKQESLKGIRERIIRKCDVLLASLHSESLDVNMTSTTEEDETSIMVTQNLHYTISFTLRIIKQVLSTPTPHGWYYDEDFWGDGIEFIDKLVNLDQGALRLLLRVFLRKRKWYTHDSFVKFYDNNLNLMDDLNHLKVAGFIDAQEKLKLVEALEICSLEQLRSVSTVFKISPRKTREEIIAALLKHGKSQTGLLGNSSSAWMLKTVRTKIGMAFRISNRIDLILKGIFTIYSPISMNSSLLIDNPRLNLPQQLLFEMLNLENRKISLPGPKPCTNLIGIYDTPFKLESYLWAKELEASILDHVAQSRFQLAYEESIKAGSVLNRGESDIEFTLLKALPFHLQRFSYIWVLVRCIAHGAAALERLKEYRKASMIYRHLLYDERYLSCCINARGPWWERLVTCLHFHLKECDDALDECKSGIKDPHIGDKDRLALQDRIMKITKSNYLPTLVICSPVQKQIRGKVLSKDIGNGRINQFIIDDQYGGFSLVSVEQVALTHYREQEGFSSGVHAEGGIWHMAMGLLFYEIINHPTIPAVWFSELQNAPLDLNYREFYLNRKALFDERLKWLRKADICEIEKHAIQTLREHGEESADDFIGARLSESEFCDFVQCCNGELLAEVCERMIKDRRNTRSGFPDLTVWDRGRKQIAVVEVKGPNDKLSTKQRLWLDFFSKLSIRAEVCHVAAIRQKAQS